MPKVAENKMENKSETDVETKKKSKPMTQVEGDKSRVKVKNKKKP